MGELSLNHRLRVGSAFDWVPKVIWSSWAWTSHPLHLVNASQDSDDSSGCGAQSEKREHLEWNRSLCLSNWWKEGWPGQHVPNCELGNLYTQKESQDQESLGKLSSTDPSILVSMGSIFKMSIIALGDQASSIPPHPLHGTMMFPCFHCQWGLESARTSLGKCWSGLLTTGCIIEALVVPHWGKKASWTSSQDNETSHKSDFCILQDLRSSGTDTVLPLGNDCI